MAQLLKGADVAVAIDARTAAKVAGLRATGVVPALAILRVGSKADQLSYERGAIKRCEGVGVVVNQHILPEDVSNEVLLDTIRAINGDEAVHGCLILWPLPNHIDAERVRECLCPTKDVDGITEGSMAGILADKPWGYPPCTAAACMEIFSHYGFELEGKRVVVVGRSLVVGRPLSMLLLARNATVTIAHSRTLDLPACCRAADIVIAAVGVAGLLDAQHVAPGQVIVDVGINWNEVEKRLVGDVVFDDAEPIVAAITPVPGGVGAVTTSVLAAHVVDAALL
jgi:methylenetetrahydrofolate dehydrogenase (NADP+) / methenyltetrahydrofolate cyclohydrolase